MMSALIDALLEKELNPILFLSDSGYPIKCYFKIDDESLKTKYEKLVYNCGGLAANSLIDIDSRTAVFVDDLTEEYMFKRATFKASYITDCVESNKLLDINNYLHTKIDAFCENYMDVIYWRIKVFPTESREDEQVGNLTIQQDDEPSSDKKDKKVKKHTRDLYSKKEKEDILKFIISKNRYDCLNGDGIWKLMEDRKICPKRTYQSLKNHFRKTIVNELQMFEFLTPKQRTLLEKASKKKKV